MKLTSQQWVAAGDTERHVLVAAGAGTGKTQTVVGRVLYLLGVEVNGERLPEPERLTLGDIAAITYTNAAAADLKKKLRTALRASGLRDEAYQVDTARIGTIHAFCVGILREFALRLRRSPGNELLDEAAGAALASEAARDAVLAAAERAEVAGFAELLAEQSVGDVEAHVATLAQDADRLSHYAAGMAGLGTREQTLIALAQRALALMEQRLADRAAIDFDSMIRLTRDLLRDDPAVRRVLQRRIRVLILDEFQDVDPVQKEIAYLLGEPLREGRESSRLLLVGDPKQSIFRFRRADVTVWRQVEADFQSRAWCRVQPLTENFRSLEPILGMVDATIGRILAHPLDGRAHREFEVPYEAFVPTAVHQTSEPCVELVVVPARDDGKAHAADEVREAEARAMAKRAAELVASGAYKACDIAVVLTGWKALAMYKEALEREGLRTYALRNEGFYERREVLDLLLALEAVQDPLDDRALFGWLRSPFVGVRDETLLAIARHAESPVWRSIANVRVAEQELLEWACDLLRRHVAIRDRVPADVLLEGLMDATGYVAHLRLLGEEKARAEANVRKFLRLLRRMPEATLGEALRVLRDARERDTREGDAPLADGVRDAVTLTSVHSAKGLEWPVVFWCDLVRSSGNQSGDLLLGRSGIALKDPAFKDKDQPASFLQMAAEIAQEEDAERKRVWYVAATRAKHRLVLSGLPLGKLHHSSTDSPAGRLWPHLAPNVRPDVGGCAYQALDGRAFEGVVRIAEASVAAAQEAAQRSPVPVASIESLPVPLAPIAVPSGRRRHSASELLAFERCARKHWFKYVAGLREPPVRRDTPAALDAITRGQIVHDVLEHLKEHAELDSLLEEAIGRWDPDAPPADVREGTAYRAHLREEVERVATHPDYRALAGLPTACHELGFLHLLVGGGVTEGAIDLAVRREDGLVLLDVKTSQIGADAARERAGDYAAQRDVYVAAAEAISGQDVAAFAFQFSRAAVQVAEVIAPEMRREIRVGIEQSVKAIEGGERSLTSHPWECRFCGYRVVGWCEGR